MFDTTTQLGFTPAGFEAFVESRHEPGWLIDFRREAWDHFSEMDWPSPKQEEWLRTDLRPFKLERFGPFSEATEPAEWLGLLTEGVQLAGHSVAVNGRPVTAELNEKWTKRGVLFGTLDELIRDHGDLLRPYFLRRAVQPWNDRFAALHTAFWSGGHVLFVPRGVVVDEPFHALSVIAGGGSDLGHTLVVLADGAEATFLSETASPSE